jgi:tRNA(Arg) A34 adenosine deaminase TadA
MCAATIYWANIGGVVFGASNDDLDQLVGDTPENLTMKWSCRDIFKGGRKDIEVIGPLEEVRNEVIELSRPYWKPRSKERDSVRPDLEDSVHSE